MTKIDIISGFLGAGKTTFIKKLLQEAIADEQIVLIENEFGEIGIDGGFLKDAGIEIREMNSGCICCSLVGDFSKALEEVLTTYRPDRVIIEPSGVGKLSDVMDAVRNTAGNLDVTLNSAVTIVDAAKCRLYMKNFGEFFNNQIDHAGTIVLSRTDVAAAEKINLAVDMIRSHNQHAAIVTTPIDQLSGAQLLNLIEKPDTMAEEMMEEAKEARSHHHEHHHEHGEGCGCSCGCGCGCHGEGHHHDHHHGHHHGHHADEVFVSWGIETIVPCDKEELKAALEELAFGSQYGEVLRAKGMLPGENPGEWYYFDLVPEEYEIRTGTPDYTGKVCVIGANLNEEELNKAFGRS